MFRVGQKVVCVDAGGPGRWNPKSEISEGQIYTVRGIGITACGQPGVQLYETELTGSNGFITRGDYRDAFYRASRFRPIVERKTDISIFKAMLTPAGKKERVT